MNRDQSMENISRHELARLTREMCELSQHSLQGQFVHVVEPRKLNVTGEKVDFFLIYRLFSAFLCAVFIFFL